ncbi:hypothetical protein ACN2WE_05350 [Streptomyces sp. cg28]|uniref:hypothetical protein n=1 Tax=Streptomyces sp. cg28 TaxID=3403457 RepID=UPI003B2268FB
MTTDPTNDRCPGFCIPCITDESHDPAASPAPVNRVKQRADCTPTEWAEQERARFEALYTRESSRADKAEAALKRVPADRPGALREAADIAEGLRQLGPAYGPRKSAQVSENVGILRVAAELRRMADEAQQPGEGGAVVGYGEVDCRTPETHNWGCGCPTDPPHRGDWTEHWLRERREEYTRGTTEWQAVDWVLDRYRLHADTGTLLSGHVCECRDGADCDCREQPEREGR